MRLVSCGGRQTAFLTTDDELYVFGSGGDYAPETKGVKIDYSKQIEGFKQGIRTVSCGNGILMVVTNDNKLYMRGDLPRALTGSWQRPRILMLIILDNVPKNVDITKVSCSEAMAFIAGGKLYTINQSNETSVASGRQDGNIIGQVPGFDNVTDLSCGGGNLSFINDGKLYDITGYDNKINQIFPPVGQQFSKVKQASRGISHGAFITEDNKLYTYGSAGDWSDKERNGLGREPTDLNERWQEPGLVEGYLVKQVSCGRGFTIFITTDGRVLSTGSNIYGQLGRETKLDTRYGNSGGLGGGIIDSTFWAKPGELLGNHTNVKYVSAGYEISAFIE